MKTAPYIFALLFIGLVFYLGFNHFELPTFFLFNKTDKTKGTVTNTKWTYGVKGYRLQLVTYVFEANDSTYTDKFKAGQREGLQKIGDKILVEYSIDKPENNEVVGYYRNETKSIKSKLEQPEKNYPWNKNVTQAATEAILKSIANNKKPKTERDPNFPSNPYNFPFTQTDSTEFEIVGYSTMDKEKEIYWISFQPKSDMGISGPHITVEINIKTAKAIQVYMEADA